jgi:hypothetical protein
MCCRHCSPPLVRQSQGMALPAARSEPTARDARVTHSCSDTPCALHRVRLSTRNHGARSVCRLEVEFPLPAVPL